MASASAVPGAIGDGRPKARPTTWQIVRFGRSGLRRARALLRTNRAREAAAARAPSFASISSLVWSGSWWKRCNTFTCAHARVSPALLRLVLLVGVARVGDKDAGALQPRREVVAVARVVVRVTLRIEFVVVRPTGSAPSRRARIAWRTSQPSMLGIIRSSSTQSGRVAATCSTTPWAAVRISALWPAPAPLRMVAAAAAGCCPK